MSQLQQSTSSTIVSPAAGTLQMSMPAEQSANWQAVCPLEEIWPNTGVCALLEGRQIAIFRMQSDALYALDNHDPHSDANVLSRGLVGDLNGEPVVASPIYKHHYQLRTGVCIEDADTKLNAYSVELREGIVWVQVPA